MKKKILGIFVCMLLITIAILPTIGSVNSNKVCTIGSWTQTQKILASDGAGDDRFGNSVEINGYDAIVGAYFDDVSTQGNAGSAYVFVYGGASWSQQQKLTASDAQSNDEFGGSVSIDGDYAIVGAYKEDGSGTDRGAAYVFVRSGSSWTEQQKLTPGDTEDGDHFGKSVSILITIFVKVFANISLMFFREVGLKSFDILCFEIKSFIKELKVLSMKSSKEL